MRTLSWIALWALVACRQTGNKVPEETGIKGESIPLDGDFDHDGYVGGRTTVMTPTPASILVR